MAALVRSAPVGQSVHRRLIHNRRLLYRRLGPRPATDAETVAQGVQPRLVGEDLHEAVAEEAQRRKGGFVPRQGAAW
ncbi:hypothetical protein TSA6c_01620 [Azospirillum sp. TSA6c]|nr:hypothetical protein TSA6c_01620 [Azospirillum sp. TSA6c]